jgi:hypothetical protein
LLWCYLLQWYLEWRMPILGFLNKQKRSSADGTPFFDPFLFIFK